MNQLIRVFGKEPTEYENGRYWNSNLILFEGKEYIVSHKAVLTVITNATCNASCKFCSNDITFTPGGSYISHENEAIHRAISFAVLGGVKKIAFSGGEPTANPQALYNLAAHTLPLFEKSRIHTNGYGLLKNVITKDGIEKPLIDALCELGLSGISLSIAHFNEQSNQDIMRFKGTWKGLTEEALQKICLRSSEQFNIRMSCVLTMAGIKGVDDILQYIEWGRQFNVKSFIFRSPSWIPSEYTKPTMVTRFNRINHVDIDPITDGLDQHPDFSIKFTEHKTDSHVHVYKYKNEVTVDIDASSEEPDPDEKIRRVIIMSNNVAYKSWIDPYSNIFPDQEEKARIDAKIELPELERDGVFV
ncbi:radical SAM protein [Paenibacillus periandrae]|uniref:radical SAM protein n=1 Tax=Paenibacillus periandrae TaxID=1761741 RepID=UPI001F09A824|nr:radical SAM protein [Paenibacillus periandrae]